MELTEAGNTKKRWQEYTEELYKKDLHDPDNHNDVFTHLEPDILECEVKWALGSMVELFQMLKDDAVKVLHSICHQIWMRVIIKMKLLVMVLLVEVMVVGIVIMGVWRV